MVKDFYDVSMATGTTQGPQGSCLVRDVFRLDLTEDANNLAGEILVLSKYRERAQLYFQSSSSTMGLRLAEIPARV